MSTESRNHRLLFGDSVGLPLVGQGRAGNKYVPPPAMIMTRSTVTCVTKLRHDSVPPDADMPVARDLSGPGAERGRARPTVLHRSPRPQAGRSRSEDS